MKPMASSGTVLYRNLKCCDDDKASSDYTKTITDHNAARKAKPNQRLPHNTPDIFVCPEHGGRNYPSKNECYQYKSLLGGIKSLLDEFEAIRKNETTDTGICDICNRYNSIGRCKRCEILGNRYVASDYNPWQQKQQDLQRRKQDQQPQMSQKWHQTQLQQRDNLKSQQEQQRILKQQDRQQLMSKQQGLNQLIQQQQQNLQQHEQKPQQDLQQRGQELQQYLDQPRHHQQQQYLHISKQQQQQDLQQPGQQQQQDPKQELQQRGQQLQQDPKQQQQQDLQQRRQQQQQDPKQDLQQRGQQQQQDPKQQQQQDLQQRGQQYLAHLPTQKQERVKPHIEPKLQGPHPSSHHHQQQDLHHAMHSQHHDPHQRKRQLQPTSEHEIAETNLKLEQHPEIHHYKPAEHLSKKSGIKSINKGESQQPHDQKMQQQRFLTWLSKVKQYLFSILESEATRHKVFHTKYAEGTDELTNLLTKLKVPLTAREPYIGSFPPSLELLENLNESNDILKEVVQKLRNVKHYNDAEVMPCPSTCKYFVGRTHSHDLDNKEEGKKAKDDELKGAKKTKDLKEQDSKKAKATSKDVDTKNFDEKGDGKGDKKVKDLKEQDGKKAKDFKEQDVKKAKLTDKNEDKKNLGKLEDKIDQKKAKEDVSKGDKNLKESKGDKTDKSKADNNKAQDKNNKKDTDLTDRKKTEEKKPEKDGKGNHNAEDAMMLSMMKAKASNEARKDKPPPPPPPPRLPDFEELPKPKPKPPVEIKKEPVSESIIDCNITFIEPTKMVKGTNVVHIEPRIEEDDGSARPLIFKVKQEFSDGSHNTTTTGSNLMSSVTTDTKSTKAKGKVEAPEPPSNKGVISYRLSNRDFIEKGWTLLPTTKIMRRMNLYKMAPANPQHDWFKKNQYKRILTYDTGEKLAEIDDNGDGRWYYRNGRLALDYYSAEDVNSGHRYVVYSSGEKDAYGNRQPVTVLASFDYLGHGVVYDHFGNERLKFNQTEGVVIDTNIGAPGHWKWHTLNEPPVLQPQFIDTYAKEDETIPIKEKSTEDQSKKADLDMIAIELENIIKEKANKLLQEFKPFQIKMKTFKINDRFSLKVLEQSKIYLIFRDGQTNMRLNLGMLLMSNEIVDTVAAELCHVFTPYDVHPPKSESIANIKKTIERAKKFRKSSNKI